MTKMLGVVLFLGACGTTKVVQYAEPLPRRVQAPAAIDLSDVSKPWKRNPLAAVDNDVLREQAQATAAAEKDPLLLIREANQDAYTPPGEGEAEGHTQVYVYDPDREYPVYACAKENVQIRLAVGERLTGEPVFGDAGKKNARTWSIVPATSGDGHGKQIVVLLISPNREGLPKQRMQLLTNVGPYTLELNVLPADEGCMRAVRWRHPQHELNQLAIDAEQHEEVQAKVSRGGGDGCTSSAYEIEVMEGSPRWVPTLVWRECSGDRAQVHIQFRGDVAWSKIPALKTDGGVADYRFDPSQKVMHVAGLFNHAMLQLGSKEQGYERVAIHALKESSR